MNTHTVTLGLIQTTSLPTYQESLNHTREQVEQAARAGAQIICLQELFLTPYFCTTQDTRHFDLAEPVPGPTTDALSAWAKEFEVVIIASLFEKRSNGLYHNTAAVIDADGSYLGKYRKMHIPQDPGFEEKFYFTPGDLDYPVWKTRYATIGVLICWDQWFPEAARLMALQGADIIFYPTAIGWLPDEKAVLGKAQQHAWEQVQCGHAVANGCYVAAVNRVGTEGNTEFWGQSFIANYYGEIVTQASADQTEQLIYTCDLREIENFRRIWPFLRDRRIDSFQGISQRAID